jgi:hypothetical protein
MLLLPIVSKDDQHEPASNPFVSNYRCVVTTFVNNWTHCSEWAWETTGNCGQDCIASCPPRSTFPGTNSLADQMSSALCIAACPSQCKGKPNEVKTGTNRIDWAVKNEGSADATIDAQACKDALNWEIGGCDSGSEQSKGGFWYRIDPNEGKCGA